MKIAIVTRNAIHGGVETMIAQHQDMFEVDVFVAGGENRSATCPFSYVYIDAHNERNAQAKLSNFLASYDVIIYHWLPEWALGVIRSVNKACIEVVHRTDTSDNDKTIPTILVTHSTYLAEYIQKKYHRDACVIPHAVDVSKFPIASEDTYIGAIVGYYPEKGLDIFIRAWDIIAQDFPNQKIRFYGSGSEKSRYLEMVSRLGIRNIEFLKPTRNPEKHLSEYKLLVHPSRIEGMPFAILEALASNVPVLCAALPGMIECNHLAKIRGVDAPLSLFTPEDHTDLAQKLTESLLMPRKPNTRDYIKKWYNIESHAMFYRSVFEQALIRHSKRQKKARHNLHFDICRALAKKMVKKYRSIAKKNPYGVEDK